MTVQDMVEFVAPHARIVHETLSKHFERLTVYLNLLTAPVSLNPFGQHWKWDVIGAAAGLT